MVHCEALRREPGGNGLGPSELQPHTQTWLCTLPSPSVRLPLTSPHSVDIRRGGSADLEAQSLWMVGDFDDPAPDRSSHQDKQHHSA